MPESHPMLRSLATPPPLVTGDGLQEAALYARSLRRRAEADADALLARARADAADLLAQAEADAARLRLVPVHLAGLDRDPHGAATAEVELGDGRGCDLGDDRRDTVHGHTHPVAAGLEPVH